MLPELTRIPGRLTSPKIRKDGRLVDASWDEAMSLVGSRFSDSIRQFGRDSVAFYGSGQLFTEESYTANKLFKAGIRTNNVDGNPRLCMASAASGYIATYGKDEPPGCYADADHADVFFIIGANPYECHPPIFERIRQRKRLHPETVIVCVDPRRTKTAEHSDIHLPVVPGTDLLLLNAMAQVIFEESLQDQGFIDKHVRFSDGDRDVDQAAFRQFLQAYAPEKVEQELGVSATDIRRVAYLIRQVAGDDVAVDDGHQPAVAGRVPQHHAERPAPDDRADRPAGRDAVLADRPAERLRRRPRHRRAVARASRTAGWWPIRSTAARWNSSGASRAGTISPSRGSMPSTCSGRWRTGGSRPRSSCARTRRVAARRRALPGRDGEVFPRRGRDRRGQRDAAARAGGAAGGAVGREGGRDRPGRAALPVAPKLLDPPGQARSDLPSSSISPIGSGTAS